MEYRELGRSGLRVSAIGYGCMSLASAGAENEKLLNEAFDRGVTLFDTADIYDHGRNEELVGRALGAKRKEIVLATKVGNVWRPDGSGLDWDAAPEHIRRAIDASLRRLGTDYIDLYQLHGGTWEDPYEDVLATFESLKSAGKIRAYGISSIRPNVIARYAARGIASNMMQYSLLDRRPEEKAFPMLAAAGASVLVRGAVAQGLLAGKPAKEYLGHSAEEVARASEAVAALAGPDRPAAAVAIAWALARPVVASCVVGMRTREQLAEACKTVTLFPLAPAQIAGLARSVPPNFYTAHREAPE